MADYTPRTDLSLKKGTAIYWNTDPSSHPPGPPITHFVWVPRGLPFHSIEGLGRHSQTMPFSMFGRSNSGHYKKDYWHFENALFLYPLGFEEEFLSWCTSVSNRNAYYADPKGQRRKIVWSHGDYEDIFSCPRGIASVREELGNPEFPCKELIDAITSSRAIISHTGLSSNISPSLHDGGQYSRLSEEGEHSSLRTGSVSACDSLDHRSDIFALSMSTLQGAEVTRHVLAVDTKYKVNYTGTFMTDVGELNPFSDRDRFA